MILPTEELVFTGASFFIAILIGTVVIATYISYYKDWWLRSKLSFTTSVVLFLSTFLYPTLVLVDINVVSSFKNSNGSWQDWTTSDGIRNTEEVVTYCYLALYGLIVVTSCVAFPFVYFSLNRFALDEQHNKINILRGLKYTSLFILFLISALSVGGTLSNEKRSTLPTSANLTIQNQFLFASLPSPQVYIEKCLMFTMKVITVIGLLATLFYTTCGLSLMPIQMMKGKGRRRISARTCGKMVVMSNLLHKYTDKLEEGRPLSERDRLQLTRFSYRLAKIERSYEMERSKLYCFFRPLQIAMGLVIHFLSYLLVGSMVFGSIERMQASFGIGSGYLMSNIAVNNPFDIFIIKYGGNYIIDYLFVISLVLVITVSSMYAIYKVGVRFFYYKFDELLRGNTSNKSLLYTSLLLSYISLYSIDVLQLIAPQYTQYGHQLYNNVKPLTNLTYVLPSKNDTTLRISQCSPSAQSDECVMSRLSSMNARLLDYFPFFGAIHVFSSFAFAVCFVIGLVTSLMRVESWVEVGGHEGVPDNGVDDVTLATSVGGDDFGSRRSLYSSRLAVN